MSILTDEQIDKLQEIIDSIPDYFDDVEDIQCPHCGEKQSLEADSSTYTEDTRTETCGDCDKKFTISGSMSWSWSTEKLESSKGDK